MRALSSRSFGSDHLERWLVAEGVAHAFVVALDEADRGALVKLLTRAMDSHGGGQAAIAVADMYLSDPSLLPQAFRNSARR